MNDLAQHSTEAETLERKAPVIMQVLPELVTGGVERGTVDVAAAIVEAGWTSIVVSHGGPMVGELKRTGSLHIEMPVHSKHPWTMHFNANKLAGVAREFGVDIIHARSRAPAWSALKAAKLSGAHFVTTFHGTYNLGPLKIKRPYNAVMTKGERVIAISHFIAEHIVREYAIDPSCIRVIQRGIDLDRFDPNRVSPERMIQLTQAWRLPDGYPVILLPARLTRWKGQQILIEAMAKLGRRDVRCLLVGSDQGRTDYRQELETQVEKLGLTDIVHIVGDCSDLPAAYMLTDVVVSASTDPEAFGRTIVEAQAMGRPVVASDHGGARETVIEGKTGWLFPSGDAEALAQSITSFLDLPEEIRDKIAGEAMAHARAHFDKRTMCKKTLAVYAEVLDIAPPWPVNW
jgi:glycosyltransferase involved in cell wall biosynthesis